VSALPVVRIVLAVAFLGALSYVLAILTQTLLETRVQDEDEDESSSPRPEAISEPEEESQRSREEVLSMLLSDRYDPPDFL